MFYNMYLPLISESKDLIIPVYNSTSNISFKINHKIGQSNFLFKDYSNIETYINKEIEYDLNYYKMNNKKHFEYFLKIVSIIKDDMEFLYIISLSKALLSKKYSDSIFDKIIKKMEVPEIGHSFKNYIAYYNGEPFQFCGDYLGFQFEKNPITFENKEISVLSKKTGKIFKINSLHQAKDCLFGIVDKKTLLDTNMIKCSKHNFLLI